MKRAATFKVSRLASGNRRTSRFRACSCCFFVGNSVVAKNKIKHNKDNNNTQTIKFKIAANHLMSNIMVCRKLIYTLFTAMKALRYSTVSRGWGSSLMNSFKRLAASCCFNCFHGNVPS